MADTCRLVTPWQNWTWYDNYLVDPDGNRYSADMIRSSIFTLQLKQALVGSPSTVLSLRKQLEERLSRLSSEPEVTIRFNGYETVVRLKSSA
jgi:hypothetical protein